MSPVAYVTSASENDASCITLPIFRFAYKNPSPNLHVNANLDSNSGHQKQRWQPIRMNMQYIASTE